MQQLNARGVEGEAKGDSGGCRSSNEVAVTVAAQWQRQRVQLQSALDGRSSVDVAMTLTALSRSIDDVVHDVADPQPLYPVVQPLLLTLTRVLYESDEVACVVRAVHCLTWLAMYRFDAVDSSFVCDITWAVLGEPTLPSWLAAQVGHTLSKTPALAARVARLRVRLLDVLLALTDYDEEGRTLRNVDDTLRRTRHVALFDVLVRLCHNTSDVFVQVATLHLVGAYALAVHPRVPLAALCDLCRDVFRLSPHEMAKAACAASLGQVVATLCHAAEVHPTTAATAGSPLPSLLTEVDLETCQSLAAAMASYRGRPLTGNGAPGIATSSTSYAAAEVEMHDAVIQQHGREMQRLLRSAALAWGPPRDAEETPSVLWVQKPSVKYP